MNASYSLLLPLGNTYLPCVVNNTDHKTCPTIHSPFFCDFIFVSHLVNCLDVGASCHCWWLDADLLHFLKKDTHLLDLHGSGIFCRMVMTFKTIHVSNGGMSQQRHVFFQMETVVYVGSVRHSCTMYLKLRAYIMLSMTVTYCHCDNDDDEDDVWTYMTDWY